LRVWRPIRYFPRLILHTHIEIGGFQLLQGFIALLSLRFPLLRQDRLVAELQRKLAGLRRAVAVLVLGVRSQKQSQSMCLGRDFSNIRVAYAVLIEFSK
jgi:hypothetical protein